MVSQVEARCVSRELSDRFEPVLLERVAPTSIQDFVAQAKLKRIEVKPA